MPCVPSLCFTFYCLLYHPPPVDAPFVEWFLLPWPSLEFVPAVPGAFGCLPGDGERESVPAEQNWSVHGTPSCWGFVSGGPL